MIRRVLRAIREIVESTGLDLNRDLLGAEEHARLVREMRRKRRAT